MIKSSAILFLCIIQITAFSQNGYKWINFPTVSGIMNEFEDKQCDFLLLEGNVKEVEYLSYSLLSQDPNSKTIVKYSENGKILSVRKMNFDFETSDTIYYMTIEFFYDEQNNLKEELIYEFLGGEVIENSRKREPEFFDSNFPEPFSEDQFGNSLSIALEKDTTYSFYDEQGRKIMDSIPSGLGTEGLKNKYRYQDDRIYCEKMWAAYSDAPSEREIILIDAHGNWIEKQIFIDNDTEWSELIKRTLTYYEN